MPSDHSHAHSQSHAQHSQLPLRPSLAAHRRSTSTNSNSNGNGNSNSNDDRTGTTPSHHKTKPAKHVVAGGLHARVPSRKSLHKLAKGHDQEAAQVALKKNASTSTLAKKNAASASSLKRNRSAADVRRPKSSAGDKERKKKTTAVHFDIGDSDDDDEAGDGWEAASSTASPIISRSASRTTSSRPSASNSEPQSPHSKVQSASHSASASSDWSKSHSAADARHLTERLLLRTPSTHSTAVMTLATATPTSYGTPSTEASSTAPGSVDISSFKSSSRSEPQRAKSMGNLSSESALAPRKSSTSDTNTSRTQQKLWLQRQSSQLEPQDKPVTPFVASNSQNPSYEGRDPRIKHQLEKTGAEYMCVRRFQDPVGAALQRLGQLPGNEAVWRIPGKKMMQLRGANGSSTHGGSLKDRGSASPGKQMAMRGGRSGASSYGSHEGGENGETARSGSDEGVQALLRSLWDANYEMAGSAD